MNRIFRISGVALFAVASSLALAPVSIPADAGNLTCLPSTVTVSPSGGNLAVSCTDVGGGNTLTCAVTVSAASSPLTSAGGLVNVSASNCGTISGWTVNPTTSVSGTAAPSFTDTLPANTGTTGITYTYTVTGTGTPTTASGSIVVPGTAPPVVPTSCGTPVALAWSSTGQYSRVTVTVAPGGSGMAQFTVSGPTINSSPHVYVSNSGGSNRAITALTSSPCTFPTTSDPVIGGPPASTTALIPFALSGAPTPWSAVLTLGNTYYVDLQNTSSKTQIYYVDLYN